MGLPIKNNSKQIADLVSKVKLGDHQAASELIDEVQNGLYRFLVYLTKDAQEAEECAQESLIKALEKIKTLKEEEKFCPWLFQIAKSIYLNRKKKKKEVLYNTDEMSKVEGLLEGNELALDVIHVLEELEDSERIIILLIDLEGLSYKETAMALKISEDAVKVRLHRAHKSFKSIWEKK